VIRSLHFLSDGQRPLCQWHRLFMAAFPEEREDPSFKVTSYSEQRVRLRDLCLQRGWHLEDEMSGKKAHGDPDGAGSPS